MLSGITMLLGLTGYGFVPLPFIKATILHLPTIIGTLLAGPKVGLLVGFLFGCFSLFQNFITPNLLSFAFLNPLVSILPRLLLGPFTWVVYKALPWRYMPGRIAVTTLLASLFHTCTVLGMIYILYAQRFAAARGIADESVLMLLVGIAGTNGIPEAIIAAIIITPIVVILRKVLRRT